MAVSGGLVLASFEGTTPMAAGSIFSPDLTFTNVPTGMGQRLRIEIIPDSVDGAEVWTLEINAINSDLSGGNPIDGIFEKDFLLLNTDTLNVHSAMPVGAIVRIFAV